MRRLISATTAAVVLLSVTPALAANASGPARDDPWEGLNRKLYAFSNALDRAIIRPAAMFYAHVVPSPLRTAIRNVLANANQPPNIANYLLQARFTRAGKETGRFLMNTTVGMGGIFDVATGAGLDHEGTNFGITLGRWGAPKGPYLFLPLGGPTTVRGVVGTAVGGALDPLYWIRYPDKTEVSFGRAIISGLDLRAESDASLRSLTAEATDPYATIRSAYLQNLQSQVSGDETQIQSLPDFDSEPSTPAAPPASPPSAAPSTPGPDEQPAPDAKPGPEAQPQPTPPSATQGTESQPQSPAPQPATAASPA